MSVDFYLASRSPRRRELLTLAGAAFEALDVCVDESLSRGDTAEAYVRKTALSKARAGRAFAGHDGVPVLGADTAVIVDDEIMGKPRDADHARRMLLTLSGRWHQVLSAFSIVQGESRGAGFTRTSVLMAALTEADITAYWASGEPADKAGAYAIQGRGGMFVRAIRGSYTGVVGLPLFETLQALRRFGVVVPSTAGCVAARP